MTNSEYETLYSMVRRYQLENCKTSGKIYDACDVLLKELFPFHYEQFRERRSRRWKI